MSCQVVNPPVAFVPADFRAAYPTFAGCSDPQLNQFFVLAGTVCWNDVQNPAFPVAGLLATLLNLAVAHFAWLMSPRDAQGNPSSTGTPPPALVGRISSASEGSVSVSSEWNGSGSPNEAWWLQSPWGATWWQATSQFRSARYLANPTIVPGTGFGPYGTYFRRGRGARGPWC